MNSVRLFDYEISNRGLAGDVRRAWNLISSGGHGHYLACANPHSLVIASKDRLFREALKNAHVLLPDGTGIVLACYLLGLNLREKVAGTDFFLALSKSAAEQKGLKYFFLGSTNQVLNLITKRMKRDFPYIDVCGTYSPPFKEVFTGEDTEKMIDAVNSANPEVLWVGMTAPKQEKWIYTNRSKLNVSFSAAIGAVFDFYAETQKRSSELWVKAGLEWLPRFLREPKRLWRRNLRSMPIFIGWMLKAKVRKITQTKPNSG